LGGGRGARGAGLRPRAPLPTLVAAGSAPPPPSLAATAARRSAALPCPKARLRASARAGAAWRRGRRRQRRRRRRRRRRAPRAPSPPPPAIFTFISKFYLIAFVFKIFEISVALDLVPTVCFAETKEALDIFSAYTFDKLVSNASSLFR
jgi:hypothetical protein